MAHTEWGRRRKIEVWFEGGCVCVCAFFWGGGREPRLWGGRKQNEMGRKERVDNKFFVCRKSEMRYEGRKYM